MNQKDKAVKRLATVKGLSSLPDKDLFEIARLMVAEPLRSRGNYAPSENEKKRVLILATYPIDRPEHGGQHRVANIARTFRESGAVVQVAGVIGSDHYPASNGFVSFPGSAELAMHLSRPFLMEDYAIGELFSRDDRFFGLLAAQIDAEPDLIHVEQPWLFKFARRYADTVTSKSVKVLLGAQNIEHQLKFDILKNIVSVNEANVAGEKVLACELAAISAADGICCVSQHDLEWVRSKTSAPCIVCANGVTERGTTNSGILTANKILGHRKFALYCASGHPPNVTGFFDIFGSGIGCIAPDEAIVIAGGAGPAIVNDKRFVRTAGLSRSCIMAGAVTEECLQALLDTAHTIFLPITSGGGTNLKTAEALWAGKHIVATSTAMRGFEKYTSAQGVILADKPHEFLAALRTSMAAPPHVLSDAARAERKSVLWESTLSGLIPFAHGLYARP